MCPHLSNCSDDSVRLMRSESVEAEEEGWGGGAVEAMRFEGDVRCRPDALG